MRLVLFLAGFKLLTIKNATMKKNKLINRTLVALGFCVIAVSCSDDGSDKPSAGFAGIASAYYEEDGNQTITIPFVNGSVSASDIIFDGTATEGEDYEIVGINDEGIQISFIDDNDWEGTENLRIRLAKPSSNGNSIHTVTLVSNNCSDPEGQTLANMAGTYTVVTDDWEDFAPGAHLTVSVVDETHIRIVQYPGTTVSHQGLLLTVADFSTGDIVVASQNNGSYNASGTQATTTSGTGEITEPCRIELDLTFVLPCCGTNPGLALVLQKE
ncbi:MAG TPA: hypothetical protein PLS80_18025 [Cyclobacteriaceae bacterium]|nr:hypothetical protein [Cyclobacteriaceae bacterium]